MEKSSFVSVLCTIESRIRDCQVISRDDFNKVLNGGYRSLSKDALILLVDNLFEEHTRVTSLINDVNDLRSAITKFDL